MSKIYSLILSLSFSFPPSFSLSDHFLFVPTLSHPLSYSVCWFTVHAMAATLCGLTMHHTPNTVRCPNLFMKLANLLLKCSFVANSKFKCFYVVHSDENECVLGTHECDVNATCTNTDGSHQCDCDAGFTGNGTHCEGTYYRMISEISRQMKASLVNVLRVLNQWFWKKETYAGFEPAAAAPSKNESHG